MKKIITYIIITLLMAITILSFNIYCVNAANKEKNEVLTTETTSMLIELKENQLKSLEDYKEAYGSESYGLTAFLLNKVRIISIPLCFVGIAISAIYQYVLGVRKLDVRDKGFNLMIAIITVFVICQVLPLIFAIVVKGWRG